MTIIAFTIIIVIIHQAVLIMIMIMIMLILIVLMLLRSNIMTIITIVTITTPNKRNIHKSARSSSLTHSLAPARALGGDAAPRRPLTELVMARLPVAALLALALLILCVFDWLTAYLHAYLVRVIWHYQTMTKHIDMLRSKFVPQGPPRAMAGGRPEPDRPRGWDRGQAPEIR